MNFALVTAHNAAYQPLADITWDQNKRLYAERWGYGAYAKTDGYKYPVSQISFERTELIIELLESGKYDWIHACGCDTMITNFTIPLSDIADNNYDFVIATDCFNINNDSFLARNTPTTIAWLRHVITVREQYANDPWYDQQAMIDSIDMMGNQIKIVPQKEINSYDYDQYPGSVPHVYKKDMFGNNGQWSSGDFLIHWPGVPLERRIPLATEMLTQVIK
ncbi:Glycosyltransferase 34 [uncultured Caudovirales phage]|uniref:Glycosyltransferase 34 n=1 Tax=uncultured Caudovirales phage TaxID=2100421 RepID=A0A6J5L7U4_9CAUD|nr:Glycosyltransferase 34 [uncultured Caudovirales phage]